MLEIERKFLVTSNDFIEQANNCFHIIQGYLSSVPERTIRIRIKDTKAYITIKGKTEGISRLEWEKEISIKEAEQLLLLCENNVIDKIRYEIPIGNHIYEVDIFARANKGLIIAEIELTSENDFFEKPNWLGQEVSDDIRYYNSYLSKNPYTTWQK